MINKKGVFPLLFNFCIGILIVFSTNIFSSILSDKFGFIIRKEDRIFLVIFSVFMYIGGFYYLKYKYVMYKYSKEKNNDKKNNKRHKADNK